MKKPNFLSRLGSLSALVILIILLSGFVVYAHKPLPGEGDYSDPRRALEVEEIEVSQVVYYQLSEDKSTLWLTFEGKKGEELYFNLGIPKLDSLTNFRPTAALIGPGLPEGDLPFDIPNGLGVEKYSTQGIENPEVFHEPFTGTTSWILKRVSTPLPADGKYYLVAFSESGNYHKLWVAVGKKEAYGFNDIINLPQIISEIREFHEMDGLPVWLQVIQLIVFLGVLYFVIKIF